MLTPHEFAATGMRQRRDRQATARHRQVVERLARVSDPELDESVVEMGFVHRVEVDGDDVDVEFRLPTFWCAANFAFLMAEDMKVAVESLPWVRRTQIRLVDHFAAHQINRGVAEGASFEAVFGDEARGGLDSIRRVFRQKAFLGRQEALLRVLAAREGRDVTLGRSVVDLEGLAADPDEDIARPAARYLAARRHDGGPAHPSAPAFTTLDGMPVEHGAYASHLREIRRVRRAAEANAQMCRLYLEARYSAETSLENLEKRKGRQLDD